DYINAPNEGHIFVKLTNDAKTSKPLEIKQQDGIVQGIFTSYELTSDDEVDTLRTGGFGSTNK
ncbi:MAG: deoxyuridine 5'-triphosphate nucleotidohydrolase, partial [Anaeroplasmataceae bacterium]